LGKGGGKMKKLTLLGIFLIVLMLFSVSVHLGYGQEEPKVEWIAVYNGTGNDQDQANALAVDPAGNVYVTGGSRGSGTYYDYVTIKYDRHGNQLWVARYNGTGGRSDIANALAVDPAGNVYVTGLSYGIGTYNDYATIKYDSHGNELWVARYNHFLDRANALAVDPAGNVYVTGMSYGNTHNDYATIKYDSHGNELWVARYDGPVNNYDAARALAVDPAGNVYVTGMSYGIGTSTDYATIKYDSHGNELWVARYDGTGNGYDQVNALAVDLAGNVYVTGGSRGSGIYYDYATIKYDRHGNQLWIVRYDGTGGMSDIARALAVDLAGNVYVTGESSGIWRHYDYVTIKYDRHGNQLWIARYNGTGNGQDWAQALAVDPAGNVYVTGESWGRGTYYDYATIKYDRHGNQLWAARYDGTGYSFDGATALAVDPAGNVYVTGYGNSRDYWTYDDYVTIKYSR